MRVFVAYGYNERDKWIEDLVFPLIGALGAEAVGGKEIYGRQLEDGVKDTIRGCDALLGFLTKRKESAKGASHRWVVEELITARDADIPFVEIREKGATNQGGMIGGRQYIKYEEKLRDECLIEIARTIGLWRKMKLQLLPEQLTRAIRPYLAKPGFRCTYKINRGSAEEAPKEVRVIPHKGGLFVHVPSVGNMALIQIRVEANGKAWTSDFESIDAMNIELRKE